MAALIPTRRRAVTETKRKFDVVATKTVGDKSYYTRIGVAFPLEKGPGFSVLFDALPTNGRVLIVPERGEGPSEGSGTPASPGRPGPSPERGSGPRFRTETSTRG
jgi:hypothetical protein